MSLFLEDVYFLTRLPKMGLIESPHSILARGRSMEELAVRYYAYGVARISIGMI